MPTYLAWKTTKRNVQKSLNNTEHVLYFRKHSAQAKQFVWEKQCNSRKKDAFLWAVIIENILHRTQSIYSICIIIASSQLSVGTTVLQPFPIGVAS